MRLLEYKSNGDFILHEFIGTKVPVYAILSHTWGSEEVSLQEVENGTGKDKAGWKKIVFCAKEADTDGLRYIWVDTCCIDKRNAVELQEAINSMFRWYQNAARCYVHMSDVSIGEGDLRQSQPKWEVEFQRSRWFRRGWTLQELIAPSTVEFFDSEGRRIGDKEELTPKINDITQIPVAVLRGAALSELDVHERMSWAQGRETTRPEDMAYSLLGIFGIHMGLIYGEGIHNALQRLRRKIERRNSERTSALSRNPVASPSPVRKSYRRVFVIIVSWECDDFHTTIMVSLHTSCTSHGLCLTSSRRLPVSSGIYITMKSGKYCSHESSEEAMTFAGLGPTNTTLKKRGTFKSFTTSEVSQGIVIRMVTTKFKLLHCSIQPREYPQSI